MRSTFTSRSGLTTAAIVGIVALALIAGAVIYRFGFADGSRNDGPETVIVDDRGPDFDKSPDKPFDDKGGDRGNDGPGFDDRGGDRR